MEHAELSEQNLFINASTQNQLRGILDEIERRNIGCDIKRDMLANGIVLVASYSPASLVSSDIPVRHQEPKFLVIDLSVCKNLHDFSPEEMGAVLLHELGHFFNPLENKQDLLAELAQAKKKLSIPTLLKPEEYTALSNRKEVLDNQLLFEEEYKADEYALKFGYGEYIISSLKKTLQESGYSTKPQRQLMEKRIEKMELGVSRKS